MPPKAFKPPKPKAAAKKPTSKAAAKSKPAGVTKRKTAAKPKPSKAATPESHSDGDEDEDEEADDPFASPKEAIEIDSEASEEQADEEEEEPRASIPPELLTRLLHEFFQKEGTRVGSGANAAIGKYIDVFARESLARCVWLKADKAHNEGMLDNGFCEVEDLEKLAPQLLLDF